MAIDRVAWDWSYMANEEENHALVANEEALIEFALMAKSSSKNEASADECMLWHRRLGHLNFKTMNKLVRHNLVKGLPSNCFENNHTCVACRKGKQHNASCKTKLVNSESKPLHTLHMDFFGPTSDETSGILRNFITEIENLKELKVKIISAARGEVPTVTEEPSIPSPTPPTPPPQSPQDIPSTSQVQQTPPQSPQLGEERR
nr:putative ribonuclease H-like domain-containing protein [Tanacetum cinerariifolium]